MSDRQSHKTEKLSDRQSPKTDKLSDRHIKMETDIQTYIDRDRRTDRHIKAETDTQTDRKGGKTKRQGTDRTSHRETDNNIKQTN